MGDITSEAVRFLVDNLSRRPPLEDGRCLRAEEEGEGEGEGVRMSWSLLLIRDVPRFFEGVEGEGDRDTLDGFRFAFGMDLKTSLRLRLKSVCSVSVSSPSSSMMTTSGATSFGFSTRLVCFFGERADFLWFFFFELCVRSDGVATGEGVRVRGVGCVLLVSLSLRVLLRALLLVTAGSTMVSTSSFSSFSYFELGFRLRLERRRSPSPAPSSLLFKLESVVSFFVEAAFSTAVCFRL